MDCVSVVTEMAVATSLIKSQQLPVPAAVYAAVALEHSRGRPYEHGSSHCDDYRYGCDC